MLTIALAFLIAPFLLAFLPVVIPLAGKLLVDLFGKKVPKRVKPFVAVGVGLAAGAAAHYAGIGDTNAQLIAALGGPGAVAAHEMWEGATNGRARRKTPQAGPQPKDPHPGE